MQATDLDFYHILERRGLTTSRRHFSSNWLGTAPNYSCTTRGRGLSVSAQIGLFQRLWRSNHYVLAMRVALALLCQRKPS